MITNNKGFTLVELIVVMAVFTVVLTLAANSFNTILEKNSTVSSSEESNIEGVIGLEMFRHDLEQAGFGLPSSFSGAAPNYDEAADPPGDDLNDSTDNAVPRPVVALNHPGGDMLADTDYLAIKGTTLGSSQASQRWTYVNYSSIPRPPHQWASENLSDGNHVVVLNRTFNETGVTNQLVTSGGSFDATYSSTAFDSDFSPPLEHQIFTIYGVDGGTLRMPFNRTDYFVETPDPLPARCAPNTGSLFKAIVSQSNGTLSSTPVLECVADMQVVFGWDLDGDGLIDAYSDADGSTVNGGLTSQVKASSHGVMETANGIRGSLKLIKVYILAQDGKKDPFYTSSISSIKVGADGEENITNTYVLNSEQKHYRWKVYKIVVRPKNLSIQ
jgi:prepilin-type N-terminal cleavage/methylation domain-containing protein